jgi:hypothetical protein
VLSLQLIDDQGQVWDGGSRQLRHAYDSPYSGGEFSDYAVVNLGFIATNVYGQSAQIRMRPGFTADAAFDALYRWLLSRHFDRVVLTWLDDGWHNEMLRTNKEALIRLDDLIEVGKRERPDAFLSQNVTAPTPRDPKLMQQLFNDWPKLSTTLDETQMRRLLEPLLGHRYVVVKAEKNTPKLVFSEFGGGIFANYDVWRSCAIGAPIQEQPDRLYGRWVADAYAKTLNGGGPRLDQVDAIVRWPHEGRLRMRYQRLIVPIKVTDTEVHLLGGSVVDDRIDLRVTRRQKT